MKYSFIRQNNNQKFQKEKNLDSCRDFRRFRPVLRFLDDKNSKSVNVFLNVDRGANYIR